MGLYGEFAKKFIQKQNIFSESEHTNSPQYQNKKDRLNELKKRVIDIRKDSSLSDDEKTSKIKEISEQITDLEKELSDLDAQAGE